MPHLSLEREKSHQVVRFRRRQFYSPPVKCSFYQTHIGPEVMWILAYIPPLPHHVMTWPELPGPVVFVCKRTKAALTQMAIKHHLWCVIIRIRTLASTPSVICIYRTHKRPFTILCSLSSTLATNMQIKRAFSLVWSF